MTFKPHNADFFMQIFHADWESPEVMTEEKCHHWIEPNLNRIYISLYMYVYIQTYM